MIYQNASFDLVTNWPNALGAPRVQGAPRALVNCPLVAEAAVTQ